MKRIGNIYNKICDIENLKNAHKNARKDKSHYTAVKKVDENLDWYMSKLKDMLENETYTIKQSDYTISTINDKGKERELWKLPYFPHRILQWAIMLQLEEVFDKTFVNSTCASLRGRGIHYAYKLIKKYLKDADGTKYCLKIDVKKFYPNIDHDILKSLLRKKIKDKKLLRLLDTIINSSPNPGIPIGSYLSQYLANFYLTYFDHWLKEELKIKYCVRYMDDVVILSDDKERLHFVFEEIKKYLRDNLKLELKANYQIFPVDSRGIDFVGYRFFHDYTILRKRTYKRMRRKLLDIKKKNSIDYTDYCCVNSYRGWVRWSDTYNLKQKYIRPLNYKIKRYYYKNVKKKR